MRKQLNVHEPLLLPESLENISRKRDIADAPKSEHTSTHAQSIGAADAES